MLSDSKEKINALAKIFGIEIDNFENFEIALTHSSYTRENDLSFFKNYERLEFLGDAVLKLCVSDTLYKKFPDYHEGELTKIRSIVVSDSTLCRIAKEIGLDDLLILGKQEEKMGGRKRDSILACAFEAVLGAYYFDKKYLELRDKLENFLATFIKEADEHFEKFNAKAILQEYTQSLDKHTPDYKVIDEKGPEHNKVFTVEVAYNDKVLAQGEGRTKRQAEQDSAYKACLSFGIIKK